MKKNILLTLIGFFLMFGLMPTAHSQEASGKFQEVYKVPGMSKDQIYTQALTWTADSFADAKEVIQMKDRDAGRIVGKGVTYYKQRGSFMANTPAEFTMIIECKDGRYRVTFKDFFALSSIAGRLKVTNSSYLNQLHEKCRSLAADLYTYMKKASKDDW